MIKKISIVLAFLFIVILAKPVNALEYHADYQVEYFLDQKSHRQDGNVKFNIAITNLSNEVYVKQFAIVFPKSFTISNISALDDNGPVNPSVEIDDLNTKISLEFSTPKTGKDSVNHFYLNFYQDNLFKDNGKSWELIIPTIDNQSDSTYKVIVHLPKDSDRQLSIAKPGPTSLSGQQAVWDNPKTKTVYAVFGNTQYYRLELTYHLKNPRLFPIMTELALPPDTAYQKIFIDKIDPVPQFTYRDGDGNYLARYQLSGNETSLVNVVAFVKVDAAPRQEVISATDSINTYLTAQNKYWSVTDSKQLQTVKTIPEIYYFTTSTLKYNYNKKLDSANRLGAQKALSQPNQAVCIEFSDLFIALARNRGIPAREIEGYGYSQDPRLRPLSLISDVLHSWPEYFDSKKNMWVAVDPTWENTSGIDYFSSFDLNHIVFAIHGKQPDYPLPAGLYKTENSKDITVKPVIEIPKEKIVVTADDFQFPKEIIAKQKYHARISLTNKSNVFVYGGQLDLKSPLLSITPGKQLIPVIAPLETKQIQISYQAPSNQLNTKSSLEISFMGNEIAHKEYTISTFYYVYAMKGALSLFVILVFTSTALLIRKIGNKHAH